MLPLGYDAAFPPAEPPPWPICGFYIGGHTPHTWTDAEIADQPARWFAPLWVTHSQAMPSDAEADALRIVSWLEAHNVEPSVTVWIDTETWRVGSYLTRLATLLAAHGRHIGNYGSLSVVTLNPVLAGGRWSADWNDLHQLDKAPDIKATQFADSRMLGHPWDGSVWASTANLWDRKPQVPPGAVSWEQHAMDLVHDIFTATDHLASVIGAHIPRNS